MKNILNSLNNEQKKAVMIKNGPALVIAGAGSGKTKVLTHRIAYLVSEGVKPSEILAVTFTNKAAGEILERVTHMIRGNVKVRSSELPFIGTFHKLGLKILREEAEHIGRGANFVLFDEQDQNDCVKGAMDSLGLSRDEFKPGAIQAAISSLKAELVGEEEYQFKATSFFEGIVRKVYTAYERELKKNNALDFDDLIFCTVKLFLKSPDILLKYQNQFSHLFVDEYQDTNLAQYVLMNLLARTHGNIFVVGDIDQSIYGWRGADYRNILKFEIDYPNHKIVYLEENYRSTKTIVSAGAHVIAHNASRKTNTLRTANEEGEKIKMFSLRDEKEEARHIVRTLHEMDYANKLNSVAILYRTNAQSRAIEAAFLEHRIPYKLIGGIRFYERREVKDLLGYVRVILNPSDMVALKRILNTPRRGLSALLKLGNLDELFDSETLTPIHSSRPPRLGEAGISPRQQSSFEVFLATLKKIREETKTLALEEALRLILKTIKFKEYIDEEKNAEDRWQNVLEVLSIAKEYRTRGNFPAAARLFLEEAALASSLDEHSEENPVSCMTIHAAKGLEFDAVFITGLEEGLFPSRRSDSDDESLEEERRLAYVAITRAREHLYLLFTKSRTIFGTTLYNSPSRFLAEIPEHLVDFNDSEEIVSERMVEDEISVRGGFASGEEIENEF